MKPTQLRFWPDPRPLVDRLGEGFFRQLPEAPGVYLMYGVDDAALYVGKARNLRHRLEMRGLLAGDLVWGDWRLGHCPARPMMRRTLKALRADRVEHHHNVYVVLLASAAGRLAAVRAANPNRRRGRPCV